MNIKHLQTNCSIKLIIDRNWWRFSYYRQFRFKQNLAQLINNKMTCNFWLVGIVFVFLVQTNSQNAQYTTKNVQATDSTAYPKITPMTYVKKYIKRVQYSIETVEANVVKLFASLSVYNYTGGQSNLYTKTFTLQATHNWRVIYSSPGEFCVAVDIGSQIQTAVTSEQGIYLAQKINFPSWSVKSIRSNEDCSKFQIIDYDNRKRYFMDQIQVYQTLKKSLVFTGDWAYGVAQGKLYTFEGTSYKIVNIISANLYNQTVAVYYSTAKGVALILSKQPWTPSTIRFGIVVFNLEKGLVQWSDSYLLSSSQNVFKTYISTDMDNVFVRSKNHFIDILRLEKRAGSKNVVVDSLTYQQTQRHALNNDFFSTFVNDLLFTLDDSRTYSNKWVFHRLKIDGKRKYIWYQANYTITDTRDILTAVSSSKQRTDFLYNLSLSKDAVLPDQPLVIGVPCPSMCLNCVSSNFCVKCRVGYQLLRGKCVQCQNCRTCDPFNTKKCRSCFYPQIYIDKTQTCELFSCNVEGCIHCDSIDVCATCKSGYRVVPETNTCQKCSNNCATCQTNISICTSCEIEYTIFEGTCLLCLPGCLTCSATKLGQCDTCIEGYFLVEQKAKKYCKLCFSNCRSCQSSTSCQACIAGYQLNQDDSKCVRQCAPGCAYCSQHDINACTQCQLGYSLDYVLSVCVKNTNCSASLSCLACPKNYVLAPNKTCQQCQVLDVNCTSCSYDDLSQCQGCVDGYFLGAQNKCTQCSSQCLTCYGQNACKTCPDGSYLVLNALEQLQYGRCSACSFPCKTCTTQNYICTSCAQGFELYQTKCRVVIYLYFQLRLAIPLQKLAIIFDKILRILIELIRRNEELYMSMDKKRLMVAAEELSSNRIIIQSIDDGQKVTIFGSIGSQEEKILSLKQLLNTLSTQNIDGVYFSDIVTQCINTTACSYGLTRNKSQSQNDSHILPAVLGSVGGLLALVAVGLIVYFNCIKTSASKRPGDSQEDTDGTPETRKDLRNDKLTEGMLREDDM